MSKKSIAANINETESEFGRSADFTNTTFRQLSSTLKIHVFNPAEIHTELDKEIYIIPANKRRTSEVMSEFEFARVKSERAQQIQNGAQIFVEYDALMDECEIAMFEIKTKNCPLTILRMLNERVGEIWSVNEMDMPFL
jgi:DNA-directed RNA polymerase subunit K/omega